MLIDEEYLIDTTMSPSYQINEIFQQRKKGCFLKVVSKVEVFLKILTVRSKNQFQTVSEPSLHPILQIIHIIDNIIMSYVI